ncbi:MAG: ABC transporter ATP-binding protein, partial [Lentisphaeria bacterium]|nr:ABC transporter ATP-binding protein [Lentisphaeria bacterium]
MLKQFLKYYRPYRWMLVLDMSCVMIAGAIDLVFPLLLKYLLEGVFTGDSAYIRRALVWIVTGMAAMYILRYVCQYIVCAWVHI